MSSQNKIAEQNKYLEGVVQDAAHHHIECTCPGRQYLTNYLINLVGKRQLDLDDNPNQQLISLLAEVLVKDPTHIEATCLIIGIFRNLVPALKWPAEWRGCQPLRESCRA